MTGFEILHIINILSIWGYALYLLKIVGQAEHGLWKSIIRRIFYKDKTGCKWLWANKRYLFCYILIPALSALSITFLNHLYQGVPYIRTEVSAFILCVVFFGTTGLIHLMNKI